MNTFLTIMLQAQQGQSSWSFWIMMILIFVVMWLFMIRPQQKKQKELEEQRKKMKAGDRVITSGGIHGKIDRIQDDTIMVEVAKGIILKFDKTAVFVDTTNPKEEKADKAEAAAEEATPEQVAAAEEAAKQEKKAQKTKTIIFSVIFAVALALGLWLGGMLEGFGLKSPIMNQNQPAEEQVMDAESAAEDVADQSTNTEMTDAIAQ